MVKRLLAATSLLVGLSFVIALVAASAQGGSRGPASVPGMTVPVAKGAAPAAPTSSSVIFSNLGPGGTYYAGDGWCVEPNAGGCGPYQAVAMPFTPSAGNQVTQIDLGLTHYSGTNDAVIKLQQDNGGVPGTVLGSWPVAGQPPFGSCCGLTTIHVSPTIPVGAGRTYWVVAYPGVGTAPTDVWNWSSYLYGTTFAIDQGGGWFDVYDYASAFDVLGCGKLCKVSP